MTSVAKGKARLDDADKRAAESLSRTVGADNRKPVGDGGGGGGDY